MKSSAIPARVGTMLAVAFLFSLFATVFAAPANAVTEFALVRDDATFTASGWDQGRPYGLASVDAYTYLDTGGYYFSYSGRFNFTGASPLGNQSSLPESAYGYDFCYRVQADSTTTADTCARKYTNSIATWVDMPVDTLGPFVADPAWRVTTEIRRCANSACSSYNAVYAGNAYADTPKVTFTTTPPNPASPYIGYNMAWSISGSSSNRAVACFMDQRPISCGNGTSVSVGYINNYPTPGPHYVTVVVTSLISGVPSSSAKTFTWTVLPTGGVWLSGTSAPSGSEGTDGDFYFDTTHNVYYGPKTSGSWGSAKDAIGATGPTGATGATGPTGSTGTNGTSVLNGTGAPSGGTGSNGDFYLDTTTYDIYGPKTAGSWGSATALKPSVASFVQKAGDTMTGALNLVTPGSSDDSTKAASTEWVRDHLSGLLNGKGKLLVGTSADPVAQAVGSDGAVLTADSAQASGVKWVPSWHVVDTRAGRYNGTIGTNLFVLGQSDSALYLSSPGSSVAQFYIDPNDWSASGVKMKVRAWAQTETGPTSSALNFGLTRLTSVGAAGTIGGETGVGISGSITGITGASSVFQGVSSEATITTAGWYFVYFQHTVNAGQPMTYGYTLLGRPA